MKCAVLFGSPIKLTNAHKPVHHDATRQPTYYVRMVVLEANDALNALDLVTKSNKLGRDGEILLNTVEL